jgi:hypothetical protein
MLNAECSTQPPPSGAPALFTSREDTHAARTSTTPHLNISHLTSHVFSANQTHPLDNKTPFSTPPAPILPASGRSAGAKRTHPSHTGGRRAGGPSHRRRGGVSMIRTTPVAPCTNTARVSTTSVARIPRPAGRPSGDGSRCWGPRKTAETGRPPQGVEYAPLPWQSVRRPSECARSASLEDS